MMFLWNIYQFHSIFLKKGVRQGCPLSLILFNLFINDIFNHFSELGIPLGESRCCGRHFTDDIVLCSPSRTKLKKMLKKVNENGLNLIL